MRRVIVEKMIVLALKAIKEKQEEQIYLGLTLATLLVVLFGPGGVTTGSQATNAPGSYNNGGSKSLFPISNSPSIGSIPNRPQPADRSNDQDQLPPPVKKPPKDDFAVYHGQQTVSADQPQPADRSVDPSQLPPPVKKPVNER